MEVVQGPEQLGRPEIDACLLARLADRRGQEGPGRRLAAAAGELDQAAVADPPRGEIDGVRRLPPPAAAALVGGAGIVPARHLVPVDGGEVPREPRAGLDLRPPGLVDGGWRELAGTSGRKRIETSEQQQGRPDRAQEPSHRYGAS